MIVQFLGIYNDPSVEQPTLPVIVIEKMQQSLRDLVENYSSIPLNVKLSILNDACLGLRYLHSRNPPIVHCDLTPNNILLGGHLEAKITDLGIAKVMSMDDKLMLPKLPATPEYMPPEAQSRRPVYGAPLDVFSFGGVILYVISQQWPANLSDRTRLNPGTNQWEVVPEVTRRQVYLDMMPQSVPDLKPLVVSCLDDISNKRPPVVQISVTIKKAKDECNGIDPITWWIQVTGKQQPSPQQSPPLQLPPPQQQQEQPLQSPPPSQQQMEKMSETSNSLTSLMEKMIANNEENIHNENNSLKADNDAMRKEIGELNNFIERLKTQLEFKASTALTTMAGDISGKPISISWKEMASAPRIHEDHMAVWLNGLVYVGGGCETHYTKSYQIDVYSVAENLWSSTPIHTPCSYFAMTALNSHLIVAGGRNRNDKCTEKVFILTEDDQLEDYTNMITPKSHTTIVGYQAVLIVVGGLNNEHQILSSVEIFDSVSRQWHICSDNLPQPHYLLQSVVVNNVLYLLGGIKQNQEHSLSVFIAQLNALSRYQLKWESHQHMNIPWQASAPVSALNGTRLLLIGGSQDAEGGFVRSTDVHMFNEVSQCWEVVGQLPSARAGPAVISMGDNKLLVFGGVDDKGHVTNTIWIGSCELQ